MSLFKKCAKTLCNKAFQKDVNFYMIPESHAHAEGIGNLRKKTERSVTFEKPGIHDIETFHNSFESFKQELD
jgi:hypothetical protein